MAQEACLHIAICDDDPAMLRQTTQQLERHLNGLPHCITTFATGDALLHAAARGTFHLAVLDVRLAQGENGIALGQKLLALQPECQIIFLTAFVAYCQDVYDVDHIAFVLKEDMETRLPVAVARACARLAAPPPAPPQGGRLILGAPGGATQLPVREIIYLERRVRTTWVHTLRGETATSEKLEALLARLDPDAFCQVHKSFAVHWPMVEQYGKATIRLQNGAQVPISRRYAARVRQGFLRYVAAQQKQTEPEGTP